MGIHCHSWARILLPAALAASACVGHSVPPLSDPAAEGQPCDATLPTPCQQALICFQGSCWRICSDDRDCDILTQHCGEDSLCQPGSSLACGNGLVELGEACDDGNQRPADGCDVVCQVELGWGCTGQPSACTPLCGNGRLDLGEACDDGGAASGDGCTGACALEAGWVCAGQPSSCQTRCGDGVVAGAEQCDDGDNDLQDECPSGDHGSCRPATCGDGYVFLHDGGPETCDDGGTEAGDGCGPSCRVDPNWDCTGRPSQCVCATGFQDRDGDGTCLPTCATAEAAGLSCLLGACSDANGVAHCACQPFSGGAGCDSCVVYVAPGGLGDGSSWDAATGSIGAAVALAGELAEAYGACQVWAARGTYRPFVSVEAVAALRPGVGLFGGLRGDEVDLIQSDPTANPVVIDGFGLATHVLTAAPLTVVDGVVLRGGRALGDAGSDGQCGAACGGGLYASGTGGAVTVRRCRFEDNHAANDGGGLYAASVVLLLSDTRIDGGHAERGGALAYEGGSLRVSGVTIGASTARRGAGLHVAAGAALLVDLTVRDSVASEAGGGLYLAGGAIKLQRARLEDNRARDGGGLVAQDAQLVVSDTRLAGNVAGRDGGGGLLAGGQAHLTATALDGNRAAGRGGGLALDQAELGALALSASGNQAGRGGGLALRGGTLEATHLRLLDNRSSGDGGGLASEGADVTLNELVALGNRAAWYGGALQQAGGALRLQGGTLAGGGAYDGGALYIQGVALTLDSVIITGNHASARGGGLYLEDLPASGALARVVNSVLLGNHAAGGGGAVYHGRGQTLELYNSSLLDNRAMIVGGVYSWACLTARLHNDLLWGNLPTQLAVAGGCAAEVRSSLVQGGASGSGNLDADPRLRRLDGTSLGVWEAISYDGLADLTTLRDADADGWSDGALAGALVELPAPPAGLPAWLPIAGNDVNSLMVRGDARAFVAPGTAYRLRDYHLASGSPCVDAGVSGAGIPALDIDGQARGAPPDIGADEHRP